MTNIKSSCEKTKNAHWDRYRCVIENRETSNGIPIRIEMNDTELRAYRIKPADVITLTVRGKTTHIDRDDDLSEDLTKEPLLRIWKQDSRLYGAKPERFHVRFAPLFFYNKMGTDDVGRKELCTSATLAENGFLNLIGLNCKEPIIKEWIKSPFRLDVMM